jgi:hypothetical protein
MLDHAMERSPTTSHSRRLLHAHSTLIDRTAVAPDKFRALTVELVRSVS